MSGRTPRPFGEATFRLVLGGCGAAAIAATAIFRVFVAAEDQCPDRGTNPLIR